MKVSKDKYNAIKKATGTADKIANKFGVSCTMVRRIRGSLSYEAYKNGMSKKGSLTNATASGKKKAGSSSSTTKPKTSDKPKSNLNKDKYNKDELITSSTQIDMNEPETDASNKAIDDAKEKLDKRENSLVARHDALIHDYIEKSNELDSANRKIKALLIAWVILFVAFIIAFIK